MKHSWKDTDMTEQWTRGDNSEFHAVWICKDMQENCTGDSQVEHPWPTCGDHVCWTYSVWLLHISCKMSTIYLQECIFGQMASDLNRPRRLNMLDLQGIPAQHLNTGWWSNPPDVWVKVRCIEHIVCQDCIYLTSWAHSTCGCVSEARWYYILNLERSYRLNILDLRGIWEPWIQYRLPVKQTLLVNGIHVCWKWSVWLEHFSWNTCSMDVGIEGLTSGQTSQVKHIWPVRDTG
jgi:hypothetical protein